MRSRMGYEKSLWLTIASNSKPSKLRLTELSKEKTSGFNLKGLGHAILGNFSTDQMVIELTKIWK